MAQDVRPREKTKGLAVGRSKVSYKNYMGYWGLLLLETSAEHGSSCQILQRVHYNLNQVDSVKKSQDFKRHNTGVFNVKLV